MTLATSGCLGPRADSRILMERRQSGLARASLPWPQYPTAWSWSWTANATGSSFRLLRFTRDVGDDTLFNPRSSSRMQGGGSIGRPFRGAVQLDVQVRALAGKGSGRLEGAEIGTLDRSITT